MARTLNVATGEWEETAPAPEAVLRDALIARYGFSLYNAYGDRLADPAVAAEALAPKPPSNLLTGGNPDIDKLEVDEFGVVHHIYMPAGTRPSKDSWIDKAAKVIVETVALAGVAAGSAGLLVAPAAGAGAGVAGGAALGAGEVSGAALTLEGAGATAEVALTAPFGGFDAAAITAASESGSFAAAGLSAPALTTASGVASSSLTQQLGTAFEKGIATAKESLVPALKSQLATAAKALLQPKVDQSAAPALQAAPAAAAPLDVAKVGLTLLLLFSAFAR